MLRQPSQIWRSCKNSVFSCKVLRSYIVSSFLFVKIFLSIPCIHYKRTKLNFVICSILSLCSWWQQPLAKTYGFRCQNGVIVSDSFAFGKTKSYRQHVLLVLRMTLLNCLRWLNCLCDWMARNKSWMIKNDIQSNIIWNLRIYYSNVSAGKWNSMKFDENLMILRLRVGVKFVTRFTSIRLVKQEEFCGAIAFYWKLLRFLKIFLYIFFRHLRNEDISRVLVILFLRK